MLRDPHSVYDDEQPMVTHIDWLVKVDFHERRLHCAATLTLDRPCHGLDSVLDLDTRDLDIGGIYDPQAEVGEHVLDYQLGERHHVLGSRLRVHLLPGTRQVMIHYVTSPDASGLQWLTPEQADSNYPVLYSQGECIHARSYLPCQDTPRVRVTYRATLTVPQELRGLMAASHTGLKIWQQAAHEEWEMRQPIPSYLIALAVGEFESRELSHRSRVWALPHMVEKAVWEFAEIEKIIQAAEGILGPYLWERFDLLIMPRSFPFGGMENPTLTFLNPALIVGDRSLVSVVAHEAGHSWTGNLVTNAEWRDFWLNEGFTTYAQHLIAAAVWGQDTASLQMLLLKHELDRDLERFSDKPDFTWLQPPLSGSTDPDDTFSRIPYAKGALFLLAMQYALDDVGLMIGFLRDYIQAFAFTSITTNDFLAFAEERFPGMLQKWLKAEAWIHGPGLPANTPTLYSPRAHYLKGLAQFRQFPGIEEGMAWNGTDWSYYLGAIPQDADSAGVCMELNEHFALQTSPNAEIRCAWLNLAFASGVDIHLGCLEDFLGSVGRGTYLRLIYTNLLKKPETAAWAREVFARLKSRYHPIVQSMIGHLLAESEPEVVTTS